MNVHTLRAATLQLDEVVVDPSRWPLLLDQLALAAGAEGSLLLRTEDSPATVPCNPAFEEIVSRYFRDDWYSRDIRRRAIPQLRRNGIAIDSTIFDHPNDLRRSAMYADLFEPLGYLAWAGLGFTVEGALWCLTLQRKANQPYFSATEAEELGRLLPRLTEIASLSVQLGGARLNGMLDALDHVRRPALTLDGRGRVMQHNQACEALFDEWFFVSDRALVARDRRAQAELTKFTEFIRAVPDRTDFGGLRLIIHRGGNHPLVADPAMLADALVSPFGDARALVTFTDLTAKRSSPANLLRQLFRLTAAEARIACLLEADLDLGEAAEELRISKETARAHLKQVFAKTGTNRQSELVSLLNRLSGIG